jgi:hypothetical protein
MNMVARMHGATIKRNVPGAVKNLRRKTNIKNAVLTIARKHAEANQPERIKHYETLRSNIVVSQQHTRLAYDQCQIACLAALLAGLSFPVYLLLTLGQLRSLENGHVFAN